MAKKQPKKKEELLRGFLNNAPLSVAAPDLSPEYDAKAQPRAVWDIVDGEVIEVLVGRIYPLPAQKYYAKELCYMLNRSYHHDGRWQVVWTEPVERKFVNGIFRPQVPERLVFSFYSGPIDDKKSKLCFDYIIDEDFMTVLEQDPKEWMEGASGAVDHWLSHNVADAINGDQFIIAEAKEAPVAGAQDLKQIEGARV